MLRLAVGFAVALGVAHSAGCGGTCGVIAQQGALTDGGFVAFSATLGASTTVNVPIQDTVNVDETVTGSSLTGTDAAAFKVLSTFPMSLPSATTATLTVEFKPEHAGTSKAVLVLDTANMGPSPIPLEGTAFVPDGR